MTADAKIGLLLGLVFIFIIAFIINGLPSLWGHPQSANATPAMSKSNETVGVGGPAQDAQRKLDWQAELDTDPVLLKTAGSTPPAAGTSTQGATVAKNDAGLGTGPGQNTPASEPLSSVAPKKTLDDGIKNLADGLKTKQPISPASALPNKEKATTPTPAPALAAQKQTQREYQVQDGDTLGTIAKKMYGPADGNKLANVQRIFESNRNILKSEDEIAVGQKLRIPPLPATSPGPAKPEDVLPASHFEKVQGIGKPNLAEAKDSQPQTDGRWYVVQKNDYLWKIAASQLGSGARSEEIAKLNAAILKSKDNLTVGMRLRLPTN